MAEVDVTIDALLRVNLALKSFDVDAKQILFRIKSDISEIRMECENEIQKVLRNIDLLISEESGLKITIDELENNMKDENQRFSELNYQMLSVEEQIRGCRAHIQIDTDIRNCEGRIISLKNKIDSFNRKLSQVSQNRRQAENKLHQLQSAYLRVNQSLNDFNVSITRYANKASIETASDISAINCCIRYIEDYLMTNL